MSPENRQFHKDELFRQLDTAFLSRSNLESEREAAVTQCLRALIEATSARDVADSKRDSAMAWFITAAGGLCAAAVLLVFEWLWGGFATLVVYLLVFIRGAQHLAFANRERLRIASDLRKLSVEPTRPIE